MGERTPIDYLSKPPAQLNQLAGTLPKLLGTYAKVAPGFAQADVNIAKLIDPQKLQATIDNYRQFGSQFADINDIDLTRAAEDQARREASLSSGEGLNLLKQVYSNQRMLDPEYFANREFLSDKYKNLIN